MKYKHFPVVVIGAGPAGTFSAYVLGKKLESSEILLIEKGVQPQKRFCPRKTRCIGCSNCFEVEGVGGAGGFSDGKLCNGRVGILQSLQGLRYMEEVEYVNFIVRSYLPDFDFSHHCISRRESSIRESKISIETYNVCSLGSKKIRLFFQRFFEAINATKMINTSVLEIRRTGKLFLINTSAGIFTSDFLIVATGKCDTKLIPQIRRTFSLSTKYNHKTFIGVRLEVPRDGLRRLRDISANPKIKRRFSKGYVKTHCFSYGGETALYKCGNYILVTGRSFEAEMLTSFSSVNIVYKGVEHGFFEKAHCILRKMAEHKPYWAFYQPLTSLLGFRSQPINKVNKGSLYGAKLIDFSSFFPADILEAIKEFISFLMDSGILTENIGVIYGPVAEWLQPITTTSFNGETSFPQLYVVGDGAGQTQGIVAAAIMGVRAAHSILRNLGHEG